MQASACKMTYFFPQIARRATVQNRGTPCNLRKTALQQLADPLSTA